MLNSEFYHLGVVALYLVMTSIWLCLVQTESHIYLWCKEWFADLLFCALNRQVLHHGSKMIRQSRIVFLFCKFTWFMFDGRSLWFVLGCRHFDVDCLCETTRINANIKEKTINSYDSFCTVTVVQIHLKTIKTKWPNAECMGTSVCDVSQQSKSCCITNKPIFCMTCMSECYWWTSNSHVCN